MTKRINPSPTVPLLLAALAALVPSAAQAQFTTETKLTASDAAELDFFGGSVSTAGDVAIVGAIGKDDDGDRSGSAYVFERNHGGANNWGEVIKLTASDAAAIDSFGESVSISGDTAIVGAYGNADAGTDSGSAYVFERNHGGAGVWGEVAKLTASDAAKSDLFGHSVSISGDVAIVVASGNDDDGGFSGSAYIFERNQGGANCWGEVTKLTASDAAGGDAFGSHVAISGNMAIVGAASKDNDVDRLVGSAYIFERNHGGANAWGEVTKLTASDAAGGDFFGLSVSISGDVAIVGAHDDDAGSDSGAAYVFERNQGGAGNWGEVMKLTASDAAEFDYFGWSVSVSADTAIVGALDNDDAGNSSGSAYVFKRNHGGADAWGEVTKLTASDAAEKDWFGYSVSISGDVAILGAMGKDHLSGAAYVYTPEPATLTLVLAGLTLLVAARRTGHAYPATRVR